MSRARRTIQLTSHDEELLKKLYENWRIPTDQFARRPTDLQAFVDLWNGLSQRNDSAAEVLHFMITRRKKKRWPKLGSDHRVLDADQRVELNEAECAVLDEVYEEMQISSDRLMLDEELADEFTRRVSRRIGRVIPSLQLCSTMVHRRKAGELETLRPKHQGSIAFADIDELEA